MFNGYLYITGNAIILKVNVNTGDIIKIDNPDGYLHSWDPDIEYPQPSIYAGASPDEYNNIWYSPFYGPLLRFNPATEEFTNYSITGLANNNWPNVGQFMGIVKIVRDFYLLPNNNNILTRFNLDNQGQYDYWHGIRLGRVGQRNYLR